MLTAFGSGIPSPKRGTSLVVSHASALEALRRARWEGDQQIRELTDDLYPDLLVSRLDAESLAADETLRPLELPRDASDRAARARTLLGLEAGRDVDVVVGRDSARRRPADLACHVWTGSVADGLITGLGDGIYVCGPELVFLQMARTLGRLGLLELGFELCGTYAIGPRGSEFRNDALPLTTPRRLLWLAELGSGTKGAKAARWAARRVLSGSMSPKESQLAIMLSLPREEGGWGCGRPTMNHRVELTPEARAHCGRAELYADLFFAKARTDVEYHGKKWHSRLADKSRDDARSNALAMMGVSCNVVWSDQLYDEAKIEGLAELLRKRSGLRRRRTKESTKMRLARAELLESFRAGDWSDEAI